MQSFLTLNALVLAAALASACGVEHTRNVLVPTDISGGTATTPASAGPQAGTSMVTSLVGTWKESGPISSLTFTAQCPGNLTLTGTISGQLGGATIPMIVTGLATAPGESACQFTLNGTGVP